ncbi:MAG: aspartate carbamoyltransferase regulatory subunit [Firmicutes bacterium]|nr:aspartate carbamoyltransferase regulatory subunit [Bacillota bacterium]MBR7114216.1 aspartate carbamoyltransferase regulatory subunit [Bacillota bacterium]
MHIDEIKNGIVIDHITAGKGMEIFDLLGLGEVDCSVALIKGVNSHKIGKKDIIKIDADLDIDMDILGYIDPNITVNIIKDGANVEKRSLTLPTQLKNVLKCKNPRCITTTEQELPHIFKLADAESRVYRCLYCESRAK